MEINYNIKDISHNINVLLNTRNNIINNSNNKIIEKKCPTHGEKIIIDQLKILKSQNLIYYYEYDKVLPIKYKNNLRADLFIIDNKFNYSIIEFDGIQHLHFIPFFHINSNNFHNYKNRDKIKNKYCKDNNIQILRINHIFNESQIKEIIIQFLF